MVELSGSKVNISFNQEFLAPGGSREPPRARESKERRYRRGSSVRRRQWQKKSVGA
jgi:hypothetical protein